MSTRNISFNFMLIILFFVVVDIYVYFAYRKSIERHKFRKAINVLYYISVVTGYIGLYFLYSNYNEKPLNATVLPNLFIGFFFSFFVFKLILIVFFLLEDIIRFLTIIYLGLKNLFTKRRQSIKEKALSVILVKNSFWIIP